MTATAIAATTLSERVPLAVVAGGAPGASDGAAQTVSDLVALADGPVDPALITAAALILRAEGLVELPGVTFGSNYFLDVCSIELDRGYVEAVSQCRLILGAGKVSVNPHLAPTALASERVRARANELFQLTLADLTRAARHHLLRDAAE